MLSPLTISGTGLSASMAGMQVAAHNIANASVDGYRRHRAELGTSAAGGVDVRFGLHSEPGSRIEADLVGLLQSRNAFLANLAVFRRADEAVASLIDDLA